MPYQLAANPTLRLCRNSEELHISLNQQHSTNNRVELSLANDFDFVDELQHASDSLAAVDSQLFFIKARQAALQGDHALAHVDIKFGQTWSQPFSEKARNPTL